MAEHGLEDDVGVPLVSVATGLLLYWQEQHEGEAMARARRTLWLWVLAFIVAGLVGLLLMLASFSIIARL